MNLQPVSKMFGIHTGGEEEDEDEDDPISLTRDFGVHGQRLSTVYRNVRDLEEEEEEHN